MTHVSRNKLSKKNEAELVNKLYYVLSAVSGNSDMSLFLNSLLTGTEKVMLSKRLAVVVMVQDGMSDSDIASALHLTRISVAKMRYHYESRGQGFGVAIKKLEEQEQLDEFKKLLISLTRYSIRAAGGRV